MNSVLINIRFFLFIFISTSLFIGCKNEFYKTNKNEILNSDDSLKIKKIFDSLQNGYSENYDEQTSLAEYVDKELKKTLPKSIIADYYINAGMFYYGKSDYKFSQEFFQKAYLELKSQNKETEAAKQLSNISVIYELTGDYDKATENYLTALKIFLNAGDSVSASYVYNNLGIVYKNTENFEKAAYYHKLALKTDTSNSGRASVFSNIGAVFESMNKPDSALFYYKKALNVYEYFPDEINKATVINNIGYIQLLKNDLDAALANFKIALQIYNKSENAAGKAQVLRNISQYYFQKKDYENAKKTLEQALILTDKINFPKLKTQILNLLYYANKEIKNFEKANLYLEAFQSLNDSILKAENIKYINNLEAKFLLREHQKNIKILELKNINQQKRISIQLLVIFLLIISSTLIIFIFLNYKRKKAFEIERMQNDIFEYMAQIENLGKSLSFAEKHENLLNKFDLTEREKDVLLLIAEGCKNDEIAQKLFISLNTVKTHTKNIFLKLDVKNRVEAVKKTKIL